MNTLQPRIYVACLAAYNNGYLHGEWINASADADEMYNEVNKILANSPIPKSEEFAIHDFEDFGEININEHTGLEKIAEFVTFIEEHGELGTHVYAYTQDLNDAKRLLEECYQGEFDSEEDFAYYWTYDVDCREIPEYLENYIDYKAMARDLFIDCFLSINVMRVLHIFSFI